MTIDTLEHAFDHVQVGFALVTGDTTILRVNPAGAAMLGGSVEDVVGTLFLTLVHPDDLELSLRELGSLVGAGQAGPITLRLQHVDGSWRSTRAHATRLPGDEFVGFVVFEDVTAEIEVVAALAAERDRSARRFAQQQAVAELGRVALAGLSPVRVAQRAAELMLDSLGARSAVVFFDDEHPDGVLQVAGAGPHTAPVGSYRRPRDDLLAGLVESRQARFVSDVLDPHTIYQGARFKDGLQGGIRSLVMSPIVPSHAPAGFLLATHLQPDAFTSDDATFLEAVANVIATSLDRTRSLDDLRHQAQHDSLTELPNRALLLDHLEAALAHSRRHHAEVAVLICDIDRFKVINDGLGHAAGDEVLRVVADRLARHLRPGDSVGRFGGDEFVVVCPDVPGLPMVVAIAERLSAAVSEPIEVAGTRLVVSASIGIAIGHNAGPDSAAGLLRDADAAMYRAKANGRARYELFDDAMRDRASRQLQMETELRRALASDELVVHYQPVVTAKEGQLVGVEALVRWAHPDHGLTGPDGFLTVAQEAGLLPAIGHRVLALVAAQTAEWAAQRDWPLHWVAVNLDARELVDGGLVGRVDEVLRASGTDPRRLRVEITEDALLEDSMEVAAVLEALRRRGLSVSIDDFGTGYSSLAYLKRLAVDALKLDRAFVDGLRHVGSQPSLVGAAPTGDVDDNAIASAVIQMAGALGLSVVAEGVETTEQLEVLQELGCDLVQGYLIARPMAADELAAWIATSVGGQR